MIEKLKKFSNEEIETILNILAAPKLDNPKQSLGKKVYKKFRYIDPKVYLENRLVRLSQVVPNFEVILAKHKEINERGIIV